MAGDSEYAQRQFREHKAQQSKSDQIDRELRTLRGKVRDLERRVMSLAAELSERRVIGARERDFS